MNITIPQMQFVLPEWRASDFSKLKQHIEKMTAIGTGAGKGSDRFRNSCKKLLEAALTGNGSNLSSSIEQAIDVRAFTYLLCTSDKFCTHVRLERTLLDHLIAIRSPMSMLALTQLIRAYFTRWDLIAGASDLEDWSRFLQFNVSRFKRAKGTSSLKTYAHYQESLFSVNGPQNIVNRAQVEKIDFDNAVKRFDLDGFAGGRYLTLCRYHYYLQTLRKLPVGAKDPVLAEICNPDVVNAPYSKEKLLGHEILEILIDRTGSSAISEAWQNVILTIAGDPRVPRSHPNYQQWWEVLGDKRVALMRGWLSRFDLKLFLKILEQSAKDGNNEEMERMFVSRKTFMEGLLDQGLVTESRLFLSAEAIWYLKRHYDKKELPDFARVTSSKTSMIYLNVANRVHILEGSHSFKLKLMNQLPDSSQINDYGTNTYSDRDLRINIERQYYQEYGNAQGFLNLTHDVHLNWQHSAIRFFQGQGVKIEAGSVIAKARYREYKAKFGIHS